MDIYCYVFTLASKEVSYCEASSKLVPGMLLVGRDEDAGVGNCGLLEGIREGKAPVVGTAGCWDDC